MMEKESDAGDPVQKPYPPPPPPPMNQPYPPPQLDHQLRYYQPPPGSHFPHELHVSAWSTGICDCLTDIPLCCVTCLCPCITFGQIAEIVDRGSSTCETTGLLYSLIFFFTGAQFVYSCTYRSRLRLEYGISGDVVTDLCVHIFCETCALCQEYRELKHRGYDVPLGWHGNMARQGVQMAPMPPEGMTR